MNLPNIITMIRFILVPIFGYYMYKEQYYIAISLFTIAGISDVLDGYLARKLNIITSFGKIADPLADKLMQITALVFLGIQQLIPLSVVIIVISKEVCLAVGSMLLYKKDNFVVSANWYGKFATVVLYFAVVLIIIMRLLDINSPLANIAIIIALLCTLYAFAMYFIEFLKIRKN